MTRYALKVFGVSLTCPARWLRTAGCGLLALFSLSAFAQAGKPDLVVGTTAGATQELGPLLLSPAQRRNLEAVRKLRADEDEGVQVLPSDTLTPTIPDALVVSGVVVRSGNRSTVWINDQPLYGQAAGTPLRTLAGQAGVLQSRTKDVQLKVRPGQVMDIPSGQSIDLLPPGSIRIIPPRVEAGRELRKER